MENRKIAIEFFDENKKSQVMVYAKNYKDLLFGISKALQKQFQIYKLDNFDDENIKELYNFKLEDFSNSRIKYFNTYEKELTLECACEVVVKDLMFKLKGNFLKK